MITSSSRSTVAELSDRFNETFTVHKRDGRNVPFAAERIYKALERAFYAEYGLGEGGQLDQETLWQIGSMTEAVVESLLRRADAGETLEIELVQDAVETQLMKDGFYSLAKRYILYREDRKKARSLSEGVSQEDSAKEDERLFVVPQEGKREDFDPQRIRRDLIEACRGHDDVCSWQELSEEVLKSVFSGITPKEILQAQILAARARIETEPAYSFVTARILLKKLYREVWARSVEQHEFEMVCRSKFVETLKVGIENERLTPDLMDFDLEVIAAALKPELDQKFMYLGLQIIYDRYLIHIDGRRIETPQYFWMRVAMGLAINEGDQKNERAIEFYNMFSSFRFVSSTPTLFNSGTCHPQLSSCYLLTVQDELEDIFKIISDDARLSKWAGGLGNDWTNVRATGSHIKGTNGTSQGVIPFLKVANDTAVAVNQGGKRKGALCSYLETWHIDVEDFLELRKNTGDERRRTHDMHTANWIPDLFMKRVRENGQWTLFTPSEAGDLHDLFGAEFEKRYEEYEAMAERGELRTFRRMEASQLWRKMITMLFETGHPWITFKDPSNVRSPQDHKGVVHSSNLCTEILLNTSKDESAVCNLGSVNLVEHIGENGLDEEKIKETVTVGLRMLDNVIDINFYPIPETRRSNMQHRPVGMGIMGFQDALHLLDISYASHEGVQFADESMEMVSYYAILSSAKLADERGHYPSYGGSKWHRGQLPIDTVDLLEKERGGYLRVDRSSSKDWSEVRKAVELHGMRNCNCMAIAPTATIANITGVSQSIEPAYKHLYVKSNLSGDFTVVNPQLVNDLKALDLWDQEMIDDLKYFDGSIAEVERIPEAIRHKYITAFEMDSHWLIDAASRRQKWIDMGQSLNLYCAEPSGKKLSDMYFHAWESGLKTTYYLRSLSATQVEKSTLDVNKRGVQPRWMKNKSASSNIEIDRGVTPDATDTPIPPRQCSIDDPDCESCQ